MGWCDLCAACERLSSAELVQVRGHDNWLWDNEYFVFKAAPGTFKRIRTLVKRRFRRFLSGVTAHLHWQITTLHIDSDSPFIAYEGKDLISSASAGCNLCTLLLDAESQDRAIRLWDRVLETDKNGRPWMWVPVLCCERFDGQNQYIKFLPLCYSASSHAQPTEVLSLLHLTTPTTSWTLPDTYRGADVVDPKTITLIRTWLDDCTFRGRHAECSQSSAHLGYSTTDLPQRLIEVQQSKSGLRLRLVETASWGSRYDDPRRGYLALSHCWGNDEIQCKLSTKNEFEYKRNISIEDIPRTFRDTALFAALIDIRYMWIDALCIVQDDDDEWCREAPRMAVIYSNATVCIAAVTASNPTQGLFNQNPCLRPCTLKALWADGPTCVKVDIPRAKDPESFKQGPLDERAWTFQEQQLSSRTIYFLRDQLLWACKSECRYETWDACDPGPDDYWRNYTSTLCRMADSPAEKLEYWQKLVSAYSARKLTRQADKLIAISGVAQAFARVNDLSINGDRQPWLAGLWRCLPLLQQLAWFTRDVGVTDELEAQSEDDGICAAPSWSWASAQRAIEWVNSAAVYHSPLGPRANTSCSILSAFIQSGTVTPYGPTATGEIHMRGPLFRIGYDGEYGSIYQPFNCASRPSDLDYGHRVQSWCTTMWWDSQYQSGKSEILFFVPIVEHLDRPYAVGGPALSAVRTRPGVYRRIGYFRSHYFIRPRQSEDDGGSEYHKRVPISPADLTSPLLSAGTRDLPEEYYVESHGDGIYTFIII